MPQNATDAEKVYSSYCSHCSRWYSLLLWQALICMMASCSNATTRRLPMRSGCRGPGQDIGRRHETSLDYRIYRICRRWFGHFSKHVQNYRKHGCRVDSTVLGFTWVQDSVCTTRSTVKICHCHWSFKCQLVIICQHGVSMCVTWRYCSSLRRPLCLTRSSVGSD